MVSEQANETIDALTLLTINQIYAYNDVNMAAAGLLLKQCVYMLLMQRLLNRARQPLQDGAAL